MIDILTLIGRDTQLKRVASTNGGEWAGPCPFCGGRDRFRVWPNASPKPRWWCRQCQRKGDAIDYLQERDGLSFPEAKAALGIVEPEQQATQPQSATRRPPVEPSPPSLDWQLAARAVVQDCRAALASNAGAKARQWLARRGIEESTLTTWELGYNPLDQELHGLWIPKGVVIPCAALGEMQYIKVRRPVPPLPGPKYKLVKDSRLALYGLDRLQGLPVAVVCESEFDALLLQQLAGDLVDVVAVGGAGQHPATRYLLPLARSRRWIVALDPDDAGRGGAAWWGGFSARVRQARPTEAGDLTDYHKAGGDLRAWILELLAREGLSPADTLEELYAQADALLGRIDGSPEWYSTWAKMEARILAAESKLKEVSENVSETTGSKSRA